MFDWIADWFRTWNWGDVPGWLGVLLAIAIPAVAYFERNRIVGFFRKKAAEPLPMLAPARWLLRPSKNAPHWVLINNSSADAFNVLIEAPQEGSEVMDEGFWPQFPRHCVGTVALRLSPDSDYLEIRTPFRIRWQDASSVRWERTIGLPWVGDHSGGLDIAPIEGGKVVPDTELKLRPNDEEEPE